MVLLEELRSIAKSVEFHLGAGRSAEGRAADEIEWLQHRVAILERVIRDNLQPSHCGDGPDRRLVEEIVRRQESKPAQSHAERAARRTARPVGLDGKGGSAHATTTVLAGQRASVGEPQPESEPEGETSREHQPTLVHEPQPAPAIADSELESADQILFEMAQQVQAALLRSARRAERAGSLARDTDAPLDEVSRRPPIAMASASNLKRSATGESLANNENKMTPSRNE
jgi:hypothetical protein